MVLNLSVLGASQCASGDVRSTAPIIPAVRKVPEMTVDLVQQENWVFVDVAIYRRSGKGRLTGKRVAALQGMVEREPRRVAANCRVNISIQGDRW
jgi:hypothetical protein